jgi:hypothetical protein
MSHFGCLFHCGVRIAFKILVFLFAFMCAAFSGTWVCFPTISFFLIVQKLTLFVTFENSNRLCPNIVLLVLFMHIYLIYILNSEFVFAFFNLAVMHSYILLSLLWNYWFYSYYWPAYILYHKKRSTHSHLCTHIHTYMCAHTPHASHTDTHAHSPAYKPLSTHPFFYVPLSLHCSALFLSFSFLLLYEGTLWH